MYFFKNLPYFFLALGLAIVYVWNVNSVERAIRKNQILSDELSRLRWEYWTLKSGMIYNSIETEVSKKVVDKEIMIGQKAPKRLVRKEN